MPAPFCAPACLGEPIFQHVSALGLALFWQTGVAVLDIKLLRQSTQVIETDLLKARFAESFCIFEEVRRLSLHQLATPGDGACGTVPMSLQHPQTCLPRMTFFGSLTWQQWIVGFGVALVGLLRFLR